jgi:hypothetical protein
MMGRDVALHFVSIRLSLLCSVYSVETRREYDLFRTAGFGGKQHTSISTKFENVVNYFFFSIFDLTKVLCSKIKITINFYVVQCDWPSRI